MGHRISKPAEPFKKMCIAWAIPLNKEARLKEDAPRGARRYAELVDPSPQRYFASIARTLL